jgi:AcrR family transcriptional regulator
METLSPKKQQIVDRESRILELALPMIATGGLAALSMDAIALDLKTAKGTVYNHFRNKEEIVLALAIRAMEQRLAVFNRAVLMRGSPRQRIAAIGIGCEVYADLFPELFRIELMIRNDQVWDKTSPERQEVLRSCEARCMHAVAGVVRDAVAGGDLDLPAGHVVEDLVFGLWSQVHGGMILELSSPSLVDVGIRDPRRAIRRACNAFLDGFSWKPIYEADKYEKWIQQVRADLTLEFQNR